MIPALAVILHRRLKFLDSKWEFVNLTGKDGKTCLVVTCIESELSPQEIIQTMKDDAGDIERMAKALEWVLSEMQHMATAEQMDRALEAEATTDAILLGEI